MLLAFMVYKFCIPSTSYSPKLLMTSFLSLYIPLASYWAVYTSSLDREIEHKHLGRIGDTLSEWEGRIADELDLTSSDAATIKKRHPGELHLQA